MKIILFIPLLVFLSCKKPLGKTVVTPGADTTARDTTSPVTPTKEPGNSKYHTTKDTVYILFETGDTSMYTREEYNNLVDKHPEFFDDYPLHPDLAYNSADKEGFSSEAGQDGYYELYAYFLEQKNGVKKYAAQRKKLINIYENINSLYARIQQGGTYFGHMSYRIAGFAEHGVLTYKRFEEDIARDHFIKEEKALYIKSLRLLAGHDKVLNKIVDAISRDITDVFYLQRAQEFQHSNYEYY